MGIFRGIRNFFSAWWQMLRGKGPDWELAWHEYEREQRGPWYTKEDLEWDREYLRRHPMRFR